MKKLFATLAALAALALGVSLPAIAQNPDTPPAVADSTVTVDTGVLVVEVPAPSDSVVVADPLLPVPEEVTDPEVAGPEADTLVDPVIPLIETTPACKIDRQLANHLSIGVSAGFDGIGGQLALSLGPHFDVRAGYTYLNSIERTPRELAEGSFGSMIPSESDLTFEAGDGGREIHLYDVPIGLTINYFGPNVLFDYFPWKDASFHLTAGAMFHKGDLVTLTADVSDQLTPDEYGTLGFSFKNVEDITTDMDGVIRFDWRASGFRPYFGLGFGRPVSMKHRVGVSLDMGLVIIGSKGFYTYNYAGRSGKEDVELTSDALDDADSGIIDKISGLPVLPMMRFTINVRLF